MIAPCRGCQRQPAVTADGRCSYCAGAPQGGISYTPPPQAPYSDPQVRRSPATFVSPQDLSTALTVLLSVCIAVWALALLAGGRMSSLATRLESRSGSWVTLEEAKSADSFYLTAGVLQLAAIFITGTVFLVWFHRTRVNAEFFNPAGHRKSRGWTIGGWFVPVIALWFPKQIANDIWWSSIRSRERGVGLITAWWLLWISSSVFSALSSRIAPRDGRYDQAAELAELRRTISMGIVSDLLGIAAAVMAILFVRKLTEHQLTTHQTIAVVPWPGQASPTPWGAYPPPGPASYGGQSYGGQSYGGQSYGGPPPGASPYGPPGGQAPPTPPYGP